VFHGDDGRVAGIVPLVAGGRGIGRADGVVTVGAAEGVTGAVPGAGTVCLAECAPPQAARPATAAAATARRTTRLLLMLSPCTASPRPAAVLRHLPGPALAPSGGPFGPVHPGLKTLEGVTDRAVSK